MFHSIKNLNQPFLSPKLLAITNLFTMSIVLPFPECHINGTI